VAAHVGLLDRFCGYRCSGSFRGSIGEVACSVGTEWILLGVHGLCEEEDRSSG
jgi:hypothetical protein